MPQTLDLENDEFLRLLTDALRAGPGSPEWRQALLQLRAKRGDAREEFELLCDAREHLESGKSYRAVVAGPGFTKKVLAGIEEEDEPGGAIEPKVQAPPTANLVALISAIVLVAMIGVIAYFLLPGADPNRQAVDDLSNVYFPTAPAIEFAGRMPIGWRSIGQLPLDTTRDLRPAATTQPIAPNASYLGGGAVISTPLSPTEPVAFEVSLLVPQIPHDLSAQIFVTDDPSFSDDRATTPHELVWLLKADQATVFLPNNRPGGNDMKIKPSPEPMSVRLVMNRDVAFVDMAGGRLFAGPNQLAPDKPRYVGIRFLRTGPKPAPMSFVSVKIQKPQAVP